MFKGRISETRSIPKVECCRLRGEMKVSKFREVSPVESFYVREEKYPDGSTVKRVINDIYMLFNQQRLDRMTTANLLQWLENTSTYNDGLRSLRSKLSDAQLMSFIKSRYIQSPGELLAYSKYLEAQAKSLEITPEIQAEIDALRGNSSTETETQSAQAAPAES